MPSGSAQVVILGAGRSVRGALPSAMVDIDESGRVLDWLLDAFSVLERPDVAFVGGYRAEDVVERYPQLRVVFNRAWAETGPVESLALVALDPFRSAYVCYADVVFRRGAVELLAAAPDGAAIAVDTQWRRRYDGRGPGDLEGAEKVRIAGGLVTAIGAGVPTGLADAEFAGVLRLSPQAVAAALRAIVAGTLAPTAALPALVEEIRAAGVPVHVVDLAGDWAELDARQDLARFVLGTKAESLERLQPMDHGAVIGALVTCTRTDWEREPDAMLDRIGAELAGDRLIVRSSALSEDGWLASGAGQHESIADVAPDRATLADAIGRVFASYRDPSPRDQVLVQEMVRDVAMSGVVMTRTHALGAPYCVVNFDDATDRTDVVTAGGDARTVVCLRGAELRPDLPAAIAPVLSAVQKIEGLVGHDSLDIEFAVTRAGDVHILQVRPIARSERSIPMDDDAIARAVHQAQATVRERTPPAPTLLGATTRYSVMTDWNPAEIVGTTPRALALSLYRYLVTDDVWARQRAEYGYRDVRPCPLLVELAGHPYVDVRACFNSFVPAALDDDLARRLVEHQLAVLAAHPARHDKVEFDVLVTCLDPTFERRAEELQQAGFGAGAVDALRTALRDVTQQAFSRLDADLIDLDALRDEIAGLDPPGRPIDAAAYHLELVRRRGTPVFAHLARAAFVATSLVRGLVAAGALTGARAEEYLRPLVVQADDATDPDGFSWTAGERDAIGAELDALGLAIDVDGLDRFVRAAIAGREDGKFVFTRSLSDALEALAAFGAGLGFDRADLAHVRIDDLLRARDGLADPRGFLLRRVEEGVEEHLVTQGVALPAQIADAADLVCFEQVTAEPNFVTHQAVEAPAVVGPSGPGVDVAGRVVLIPSADPGYDWLLARGIAGLVTMFGGANSHMAVRAAECSLPAAIGVGETRYEQLAHASVLRLDCGARTISVVR